MEYFLKIILFVLLLVGVTACNDSTKKPSKALEPMSSIESDLIIEEYKYGKIGNYIPIVTKDIKDSKSVIYHPSTWDVSPTPVVLFATGFGNKDYRAYDTFLKFIATHGYSVIYIPDEGNYFKQIEKFKRIIRENQEKFDTSKIGIVGHSSGGSFTFRLLKSMIDEGYGVNDRFLFCVDPYFVPFMNKADMQSISNTNIVITQIGPDGKDAGNDTDPRVVLTTYNLLNDSNDKNYIVIPSNNIEPNHLYITKQDPTQMPLILKPLDALMEYTFSEKNSKHHKVALEGKDKVDPYNGSQKVLDKSRYGYNCEYANKYARGPDNNPSDINYCGEPEILPNI